MDYFAIHGVLLLFALALFPRISMVCMLLWGTLISGGVLWWLGFVFMPGLVVAVEATTHYWDTNPVLCVVAWIVAFGGFSAETKTATSARSK